MKNTTPETETPKPVLLHPMIGHEQTEMEQINVAIQRMRKAIANCDERDYEKAQADLMKLQLGLQTPRPNNPEE